METPTSYGLIGRNIAYSFSKKYFTEKFQKLGLHSYSYDIFDLQTIEEVKELFKNKSIKGFNVTIPYKEQIIPYLDELSDEAKKIGAVNTVKIYPDGKKIGYNTDVFGFEKTLLNNSKIPDQALVLGNGGAAKAVKYILEKLNINYKIVARKESLNFDTLSPEIVKEHRLIIQTTPVGTFPNIDQSVKFPFEAITKEHIIIDLIYNPPITKFMKIAAQYNAKTINGYYMLEQQAEKAWEIWKLH